MTKIYIISKEEFIPLLKNFIRFKKGRKINLYEVILICPKMGKHPHKKRRWFLQKTP